LRKTDICLSGRLFRALGVLLVVFCAGVVSAHVFPIRSEPRVGSTVAASPDKVRIWYDGALEPAFCKMYVQDKTGKAVDNKDTRVNPSDATLLEITLPSLPAGTYKVIWNVVARDGHRTNGDYSFAIK